VPDTVLGALLEQIWQLRANLTVDVVGSAR
jgi:hypothetical protein